ncbi:hypothetical protein GLOIN_2v1779898 [Rhizophagus clarus]|uniref:Uncharacterized protein n=1 Tax=Rhizophagus clarus TaxID=94130 RepID=A0A8H3QYA3_9GLOM|nr:hypothetical protein GLOIN_2v1779898 [Rhizophagus clarus]
MSSNLELLEQRIANLEAEKDELKGENAELKNENAKLKRIIEENARRDAENAEHKVKIEELEKNSAVFQPKMLSFKAELAKLRHDFDSSNLTRPQQPQHVTNVQNSCSVEEDISSAKPERCFASNDIPDLVIDQCVATTQDLSGVSNETTSSVIKDEKSQSHKKREVENIVQDVFDFTATLAPEKNHMTEISMTARHEKSDMNNPPNILQNLACLIQEAWDAKDEAILANQKELLYWCSYIIEFNKKITEFMIEYKIGEKKAKGMIYDNLIKLLRPGTKRNILLKQTQRARDIYKLFEKIGIDKIKYITTYSANSISELSDSQIQTIVDYFSKNPNTELPDDRDGTIIDFEEDISNDQDNVLEEQAKPLVSATRAEVSISTAPIPLTHVSNSSGDSSSSKKLDAKVKVVPPIPQPKTLVHDRSYFRNKTNGSIS